VSDDAVTIENRLGELTEMDLRNIGLLSNELTRARGHFPNINSLHEGYAVILEELEEFWAEVMAKRSERSPAQQRRELIQIAAMAIRTASDVVE
jgi:hypothetical protein